MSRAWAETITPAHARLGDDECHEVASRALSFISDKHAEEPGYGQAGAGRATPVRPRRARPGGWAHRTLLGQAGRGPPPPGARQCLAMLAQVQRPVTYVDGPAVCCFFVSVRRLGTGSRSSQMQACLCGHACHTVICNLHPKAHLQPQRQSRISSMPTFMSKSAVCTSKSPALDGALWLPAQALDQATRSSNTSGRLCHSRGMQAARRRGTRPCSRPPLLLRRAPNRLQHSSRRRRRALRLGSPHRHRYRLSGRGACCW